MDSLDYITEIKATLVSSPVIEAFSIIEEWALPDRGYFRASITLRNSDFLEVSEYFVMVGENYYPHRYRYQWMSATKERLRKRWDNVEHFPDLPGFPHHIHDGEDSNVIPGDAISILDLIELLEHEIDN